jgi:hypothetical protein
MAGIKGKSGRKPGFKNPNAGRPGQAKNFYVFGYKYTEEEAVLIKSKLEEYKEKNGIKTTSETILSIFREL